MGAPRTTIARVQACLPAFERTNRPLLALKLIAMAVFFAATNHDLGKRSLAGYAFFCFAWLVSVLALLHVAFFASRLARIVWTVLVVASAIVGSGFRIIFDAPLTLPELDRLLSLLAFIGSVFQFYGRTLAGPIALCLVVGVVAMNVPPFAASAHEKRSLRRRFKELALQISPIALMVGVLCAKHGEGTNGLPVQHTSLSFLAIFGVERIFQGPAPHREEVTLAHSGQRPLRNIIVVMDESIRGDLLDLNDEHGTPTGLKGRAEVINFGVMSSLANCSHESNLSFRYGIGRHDYLRQLAVNPSMWAYAKTAGYDRFYLDAQRTDGALQNGMSPVEVQEMTRLVQLGNDVQTEERDTELARALRRVLSEQAGKPTFVYANKAGAHYPYEGKYPADRGWYSPVLARDYFGNEADPRMNGKTTLSKSKQDGDLRIRVKNSYLNAVGWNASRFFEVLLDGLDLSETLVVYMADHGQDLHEDGRPGTATHCTTAAHPNEGRVPLAIITGHAETAARLRAAAAMSFNRTSGFSVFPSMLRWMGYRGDAIAATKAFDAPLEDPPAADNQLFLSTMFVRLGGKPIWNRMDPGLE
jgi:glucan phosphoethanolaminetransferase (alkaline phosphatase superfamily)